MAASRGWAAHRSWSSACATSPGCRRGDLTVTEVCFTVGCSSLGTFSTRFAELVGMPPSVYRRQARATAGMPACVAKQVTRPVRLPDRSGIEKQRTAGRP